MRILVDENVPLANEFFSELGEVVRKPGREINADSVKDIDALVVRSITQVNKELVKDSSLKFVGTCTIGVDHIDMKALKSNDITFASAPGCNAEAVVDYVLSSLLLACEETGTKLSSKKVGIIGAGQVGGRLAQRLDSLNIKHIICDPPRAEAESRDDFVDIDTLIDKADVICMHTPLIEKGAHKTRNLMNSQRIKALKSNTILLNAGRGDCLEGSALRDRLENKADLYTIIDVWENEPEIDQKLVALVNIATPHIAGHSMDGKMLGTEMIYQALCQHLDVPATKKVGQLKPSSMLRKIGLDSHIAPAEAVLLCARACYDVRRDHMGFAVAYKNKDMAKAFDGYRKSYPIRREFNTLRIELKKNKSALKDALEGFGFKVKISK